MPVVAQILARLSVAIAAALLPIAAAQFTFEDVIKVQEEIMKKYPDGGDENDLYREFAASDAYFRPADRSALATTVLPGRVKTVTGGVPAFFFSSTLWSMITGST